MGIRLIYKKISAFWSSWITYRNSDKFTAKGGKPAKGWCPLAYIYFEAILSDLCTLLRKEGCKEHLILKAQECLHLHFKRLLDLESGQGSDEKALLPGYKAIPLDK